MCITNDVLLWLTLLASMSLLVMLQQRRLVRRLSLFFVLIVFYLLRAAVLMMGVKIFDGATYVEVASIMSLFDIGLQLALAYSLLRVLTRLPFADAPPVRNFRNSAPLVFAIAVLGAGALTVGLVAAFPVYSPIPLDRGVVFSGFVFLLLLFLRNRNANAPEARILIGFCVVGAANILAQYGRTVAAAEHNPRLFLASAYGNIAVWIAVLVFWIFRLQPTESGVVSAVGRAPMQMRLDDPAG